MQTRHSVLLLFVATFRFALSVISLECDGSLQQLCPDDNQPRTCVCNVTGSALSWDTSISGGITFGAGAGVMAGATDSALSDSGGVFSAVLTERATGLNSSSILMFDPSTIRAAGGPVNVSCSDSASLVFVINTTSITVTSADAPSARQLSILNTKCDLDNTSYQINLQWNDGDTGGPDVSILYYLVEVTSSPPGFVCTPDQCNVTDNITTITGLSCSTEYNFTVRAVNCVGSSTASMLQTSSRITTPSIDQACFVNDKIRISLQDDYNTVNGNCTVNNFNISSNCTGHLINTDHVPGDTVANLSVNVIPGQSCEVRVIAVADCGYSLPATTTTSEDCTSTPPNPTTMTSMSSMTDPPSTSTPLTITKACLIDNSVVNVQWMPPSSASDRLCERIQHYSLMVSNSTGVLVTMTIEGQTRSVSVSVSISDYYNISLSAISECGNTTSVTTIVRNACVDSTASCQLQVGVGIPVTFLLTAIISSLITLLITCLIMRRRESHDKFTPSVVQEPVYDPVSVSGTRPGDAVEMKSNVAYGTTGLGGGANITYETVPQ